MPRPKKLSETAITTHLANVPNWQHTGETIHRTFKASNFAAALGFMSAVGVCAEVADHHPDMLLHGWNNVTITLSTYDSDGLTELDFALAAKIDALHF